jgi:hypothetical protein
MMTGNTRHPAGRTGKKCNAEERGRYVTGSPIHPRVEQVVPRSAESKGIRAIGFRALWRVAGA